MYTKNRYLHSLTSLILVFSICLSHVDVVLAVDTVTPPPTAETTQPPVDPTQPPVDPTQPTVEPTQSPIEPTIEPTQSPFEPTIEPTQSLIADTPIPTDTPIVETTPSTGEQAPIVEILNQAPDNTQIAVLDQNGNALSLTSQEALNTILETDPMWCPTGVLPGGAGCTINFSSIANLLTDMQNNTSSYTQNGIIYFTTTPGASFSLTTASLGAADFNTLSSFNLTLQGGWNGANGAAATFTGQTNFGTNTLTIGTSANPWVGNITLNNFTFNGVSSASAVTVYTTTGNITLDNVDVAQQTGNFNTALLNSTSGNITVQNDSTFDGNNSGAPINGQSSGFSATTGTGSINISNTIFSDSRRTGNATYNGATLSAPTVTLNNVTSQNNDGNGIFVNNANVVTLNNVTASNNGSGNNGSGVLVNGNAGSQIIIIGGAFTNNQRYGVEDSNTANTTVYIQSNPTCAGNVLGCYNDATIFDNTAPVITPTVTGTAGSNGWYTSNVTVSWSVTDAQSGIKTLTGCSISNLTLETTGTTLTCSATNNAGLSNSNSVTIKIDKTGPTAAQAIITGTLGSNGWYTSDVTVQTSGTDSISTPVVCTANQIQTTDTAGTVFNGSCTNNAGLTTNAAPLTIKLDKTGPTAALAIIAGTLGSNGWYTSDVTVQTSGTDSISTPVVCTANQIQTTDTAGTVFNGSCTNNAGLTTNAAPLTIKLDKTGPSANLTVIAGTLGNNGWYTSNVTVQTSGTDSISTPVVCTANQIQTTDTAGTAFNGSCANNAGLTTNAAPLTIKLDKTNPVITFVSRTPANINGWNNSNVTVNWSCTDGLSGAVNASISQTISTEGTNQSATGTCQDMAGNTASDIQSGINIDKTNPTLNLPSNMTVEATSASGALVTYSASASDNLDASPSFNCIPASGSAFVFGTTTVNCTATDHAGNTTSGNFNITVQDTTAPVIAAHADVTVEATSTTYTSPATSDAVDGAGIATCLPASGSVFTLGNTTVTCNAIDANSNPAISTSFVVHVVDTTAPVIAAHADVTAEATSTSGATVTYTSPATSDAVDGAGIATCLPASGSVFTLGNTTVTCDAIDANSNPAISTSFVVHVVDTTAPVIATHADVTVEATSASGATVTYTSPATSDAVDGAGAALCSPASGSTFALGNTTVTCNAADSHGNAAVPSAFVVHVVDTTIPIIALHTDITITTSANSGMAVTYSSPATSDVVDGSGIASCAPASGSFFPVGNTLVTCSATDAQGNAAQPITFTITITYQPLPSSSTPPTPSTSSPNSQSQGNTGFSIPVTGGGNLFNLDCLTFIDFFGIKVTFHNLCDYQATIIRMEPDTLPSELPTAYSFAQGLNVTVLFDGQVVKRLPIGTGVQLDFPIPANAQDQFAVLLWDDEDGDGQGEWLDVTQLIKDKDLFKTLLATDSKDELYQLIPTQTLKAFYRVLTTDKTATFVLVKK